MAQPRSHCGTSGASPSGCPVVFFHAQSAIGIGAFAHFPPRFLPYPSRYFSIPTVPHLPLHPATHPQSPQYGVRPCVIDKKKPVVPHGSNKNFSVCCHGTLDKRRLLIYEITNGCGGDTRSAGRIPVALVALSWQLKKIFWECPTHWISKETSA